ncbi:MAG: hypothetical protein IT454_17915 [Planctomycetes bacterium]|nr:hypothetical protein [Planctomycetota bacterium]
MPMLLALVALPQQAEYAVTVAPPSERRVDVVAQLRQLPPGELVVRMPRQYAFVALPGPRFSRVPQARAGGREIEIDRTDPYEWRLIKGDAREVELSYGIALTHRDVPEVAERDAYEHPYIEADHGMLTTGAVFALLDDPKQLRVRFSLPDAWPVFAPWHATAPGEFEPANRHALEDSIVAFGAWKSRTVEVGGARVETLFAPSELEFEPLAAPLIEDIARAELELFGVRPFEHFLFLFTPSNTRGFAGSAKQGALVLSVMHGLPASAAAPNIAHLCAHEFFHTWASSRYDAPDELRFLNEGFTDYFAHLVVAQTGAGGWEEFAESLARRVLTYEEAARSTRASLVGAGGEPFFTSREAYDQIYSGGLALAAWMDLALRAREPRTDLAAWLREFNNDARWERGGRTPTLDDFLALVEKRLGPAAATRTRSLVTSTEPVDFVRAWSELGCKVERTSAPAKAELRANLEGARIVDLDPQSLGARLGLRAGDELLEVNGVRAIDAATIHRAFATPLEGRVRLRWRRGAQELGVDEPLPVETKLRLDSAPWRS